MIEDCDVEGPDEFQQDNDSVVSGLYRVSCENAELFIKDQGIFVATLLQDLQRNSHEQYKMVVHSTALLFAEGVNDLSSIAAQKRRSE